MVRLPMLFRCRSVVVNSAPRCIIRPRNWERGGKGNEETYIKTLGKHNDHIRINGRVVELRNLLHVAPVLLVAMERDDEFGGYLWGVGGREVDVEVAGAAAAGDTEFVRFSNTGVDSSAPICESCGERGLLGCGECEDEWRCCEDCKCFL